MVELTGGASKRGPIGATHVIHTHDPGVDHIRYKDVPDGIDRDPGRVSKLIRASA
jgi:hypothetical protein